MSYIQYKKEEFIGELIITRLEALNALNSMVLDELSAVLDEVMQDDIRVLILSGAGEKAFAAGADIAEMEQLTASEAVGFCQKGNDVMDQIESLPVPVIAVVGGYALGGGCELALSCDIRLAAEQAVFGFPEVSLGIVPGYGGLHRLSRLIGSGKAKKLIFNAARIKAEEALAIGLVDQLCPREKLSEEARTLAEQIAANAPVAVKNSKKVINSSMGLTLKESRYLEVEEFADCFNTQDQSNAMEAFLKRLGPVPFAGK